ncbi:MAG: hypothetical protein K0V04_24835 [Deltaproteobacteria bacterium]|nr:hypothetical protein [Deltaproteobacteria bacterium]
MNPFHNHSRKALLATTLAALSVSVSSPSTAEAYLLVTDADGLLFIIADDDGESLLLTGDDISFQLWADGMYETTYTTGDFDEVILLGGDAADELGCSLPIECTIYGEGGDDSINATAMYSEERMEWPKVLLVGNEGDDEIYGSGWPLVIRGDEGNDTLYCNGTTNPCSVYGDEGDDVIHGGSGDDSLFGGIGNDVIVGMAGTDRIYGGGDDDTLSGEFGSTFDLSADVIDGGSGTDSIDGLGASDIVTNVEDTGA